MEATSQRVVENFACTGCGCVCDDLRLTVRGGRIVRAERACEIAEPWLLGQSDRPLSPAECGGRPVALEDALERSVDILRLASYPLIYGLAQSSTEGQRAAVSLAERLGAVIDTTASLCHAPSIMAQQQVGKVTCTLGEVRNRADMVIFWGSDPLTTHPRHWERYSVDARGRHVPGGRRDRFVVVADTRFTASAAAADLFVPIEPGRHFEALHALRAIALGATIQPAASYGAPTALLVELAERIKGARSGTIFFGVELARGEAGHCNVQALLQLAADLNDWGRRWCAMRMRVQGNVVGADTVLTWQTGYPFAVNLARGYPRFNPGEFSVQAVLDRREVDACLLLGSETLDWLRPSAVEYLLGIPLIVLDPPERETSVAPTVRFRIATPGVSTSGTAYRMDGVPIQLTAALPALYPTDGEILAKIQQRL